MKKDFKILSRLLAFLLILQLFPLYPIKQANAASINNMISFAYNNFTNNTQNSLLTVGNSPSGGNSAYTNTGTGELVLTNATGNQAGSAFFKQKVSVGSDKSFSTFFQFKLSSSGGNNGYVPGADGLVFILNTNSSSIGGLGSGIGYAGITNSLGIEFDTYYNPEAGIEDINGNHVGINLNGSPKSVATYNLDNLGITLDAGNTVYSWVDYDGSRSKLEVRVSSTLTKPANPVLTYSVNLSSYLGSNDVYAGFTSGTGGAWSRHALQSWYFDSKYNPIDIANNSYSFAPTSVTGSASPASNTKSSDLTFTVKDVYGNAAPNINVSFSTDIGTLSTTSATTNSNGQVTVKLTGGSSNGNATVKAVAYGGAYTNVTVSNLIDSVAPTNQDTVLSSSKTVLGGDTVSIASSGSSTNTVWLAPAGTTSFTPSKTMTSVAGDQTTIKAPGFAGTYKLYVVDSVGNVSSPSNASVTVEDKGLFNGKYGKAQIFDVQRSPAYPSANTTFTLSGFKNIYDSVLGQQIDWGTNNDRYVQFVNSSTQNSTYSSAYTIALNLYEANGTLVKTISNYGTLWGLGKDGFFYEGHDHYGYFISNIQGYPYGSSLSYTPQSGLVTDVLTMNKYAATTSVLAVGDKVNLDPNTVLTTNKIVKGDTTVAINSSGNSTNTVWLAPAGTTSFSESSTITKASGTSTSITSPSLEGTYYAYIVDGSGNISKASTAYVIVDNTPPAAPNLTANTTNPINGDVTVTITYPGDAAVKEYKIGDGSWTSYTTPVVVTGNTTVYARCNDSAGNVSTESALVVSNIDKVTPSIDITGNQTKWTSSDVTLNIQTTVGVSGIKNLTVKKDNGNEISIKGQSEYKVTSNGSYTFTLTNGLGVSVSKTIDVNYIDKETPELNIESIKTGDNDYIYSNIVPTEKNVVISLKDKNEVISGVTTYWSKDGTNWNKIDGNTFTIENTDDSTYNYKFKAVSGSGLESEVTQAYPVYIVKPNFTNDIKVDAKTVDGKTYLGQWTNKAVSFKLSGGINDSAYLKYQYSTDPNEPSSWKDMVGDNFDTLTIYDETNKPYYFRVVSKGLSTGSQTTSYPVKLDKTGITDLTISFENNSFKKFLNTITFGLFSSKTVDVDITANGDISGINYIEYQLVDENKSQSFDPDNGTWVKGNSLSISPEFKGAIYARAMDNAGNLSEIVNSNGLVVDSEQPTLPVIDAKVDSTQYSGEWTSAPIVITANGSKTVAGIDYYEYKFGSNGSWTKMPEQSGAKDSTSDKAINDRFTIKDPIAGTYYFRAVSNSGVNGLESSKVIKFDNTIPTTKVTYTGVVDSWTKDSVNFTVQNTNNDVLSPLQYFIKIGNNDWELLPSSGAYTFNSENSQTVNFKTVTSSGVESIDPKTYKVMIDKTSPVISGADNTETYFIGRVISLTDNSNSALNSSYKKDNGEVVQLTSGNLLSLPGNYTITVKDQAGNSSSLSFKLNSLPKVEDVLYNPNWDDLIKEIRNEFKNHNDLPEPYKTSTNNLITALENRYNTLDSEVKELKQQTTDINTAVGKLPSDNDGLIAMSDSIQSLYDKIAGKSSTLTAEQKSSLTAEKNLLETLLNTIANLKNHNEDIIKRAALIPTTDEGLIGYQPAILALLDEIKGLTKEQQTLLSSTKENLEALLSRGKALQYEVSDIAKRADAIPSDENGLISQIDAIKNILNEISQLTNEQKTLLKDTIEKLNAELSKANALKSEVDSIKKTTASVLNSSDSLTVQRENIKALLEQISTLNPEQKELLKQQISALNAALVALNAKLFNIDSDAEALKIVFAQGDSAESVTKALYLPKAGAKGSIITWSSSNPDSITNSGRITRPAPEESDSTIILTASIKDPVINEVVTKKFTLILKKLSNQEAVNEAAKQLTADNAFSFDSKGDTWESVTSRFLLLGNGAYNSKISWTSNKPSAIKISNDGSKISGSVTRPETDDESVILTATITKAGASATKTFLIVVKQKGITKQANLVRVDTNRTAQIVSSSTETPIDVTIKRTTLDNNSGLIDTLVIDGASITKLTDNIDPNATTEQRTVKITMAQASDGSAKADEQAVEIPAVAVQAMADRNAILEINIDTVKVKLDSAEIAQLSNNGTDLYFKVVPIKDGEQKSKLGANAKVDKNVLKIANNIENGTVVPLGTPYTVETNYSGLKTKLLVPFTGITIPTENRANFLNSLWVYIEHTDGTREAKSGTIVYDKNGAPIGIEITIDRFSNFQIFSVKQEKAPAILPQTGSMLDTKVLITFGIVLLLLGVYTMRNNKKKLAK